MSKSSEKKTIKRGRNWTLVIYKDSLPEGEPYKTLDEEKVPYFLAWHDSDVNADGTPKKEHGHIILMFDGNKSYTQIVKDFKEKWNCADPKRIENLRSMARYLTHMDNPEKAQYLVENVERGYGADYDKVINLTENRYALIRDMIAFVEDNDIRYYSDLLTYCATNDDTWFRALCDNCREDVYRYIYSRATKKRDEERPQPTPFYFPNFDSQDKTDGE